MVNPTDKTTMASVIWISLLLFVFSTWIKPSFCKEDSAPFLRENLMITLFCELLLLLFILIVGLIIIRFWPQNTSGQDHFRPKQRHQIQEMEEEISPSESESSSSSEAEPETTGDLKPKETNVDISLLFQSKYFLDEGIIDPSLIIDDESDSD